MRLNAYGVVPSVLLVAFVGLGLALGDGLLAALAYLSALIALIVLLDDLLGHRGGHGPNAETERAYAEAVRNRSLDDGPPFE